MIIVGCLFFSTKIYAKTPANQDFVSDFVVAKINNKIITNSEIQSRTRYITRSTKINIANENDRKMLRYQIIDKMIDEELIRQEAQKLKVVVSEQELRNALEISALQQRKNIAQFKIFLKENQISLNDFTKYLEAELVWSKIVSENFNSKIKVTNLEVEEFIEQRNSSSDHRKFLLAELVIAKNFSNNKNEDNAFEFVQKIGSDLVRGADFKELVRQFSSSISSQNNGEIGWVGQGDIDAKIYQAINPLSKNSYTKPILLEDGYHIFKILDTKVEKNFNNKEVEMAKNFIFLSKLKNYAKGYLMDVRKKAFIEIVE